MSRLKAIVAGAGGIAVVGCGLFALAIWPNRDADVFCAAYAVIVSPEDPRVVSGDQIILDHSGRPRSGCGDDDLWHYHPWDLEGVDGVLFDDCTVAWTDGRRSTASEAGIDCGS